MQRAFNIAVSECLNHIKSLEEALQPEVILLKEELSRVITELKEVREELVICKRMIAQDGGMAILATILAS